MPKLQLVKNADEIRRCTKCGLVKTVADFYQCNGQRKRIRSQCKACDHQYVKDHRIERNFYLKGWRERTRERDREKNAARKRKSRLRVAYGITPAEYERLLLKQGGKCAICGSTSTQREGRTRMFVDHDHLTQVIRGLLCHLCNAAVGALRDDPELFRAALRYLESAR